MSLTRCSIDRWHSDSESPAEESVSEQSPSELKEPSYSMAGMDPSWGPKRHRTLLLQKYINKRNNQEIYKVVKNEPKPLDPFVKQKVKDLIEQLRN